MRLSVTSKPNSMFPAWRTPSSEGNNKYVCLEGKQRQEIESILTRNIRQWYKSINNDVGRSVTMTQRKEHRCYGRRPTFSKEIPGYDNC